MALSDARIANEAATVDQCMKLGAVILKPHGTPAFGFGQRPQSTPSDHDRPERG